MTLADDDREVFNAERLGALPLIRHVEFHREVTSTNDLALCAAADETLQTPALILAARQTAGRGRGANRWWSAPGALTFSLILEAGNGRMTAAHWPRVPLACAVAVCDAIEHVEPGILCRVKWPNDVIVEGRKICGILAEIPNPPGGKSSRAVQSPSARHAQSRGMGSKVHQPRPCRIVVGIGLNVNNSWSTAPQDMQSVGIALTDVTCRQYDLMDVLSHALAALTTRLDQLQRHDMQLPSAWRSRCHLAGRHVQLTVGRRLVEGHCEGIDSDGSLVLSTAAGREKLVSGVVTHMR